MHVCACVRVTCVSVCECVSVFWCFCVCDVCVGVYSVICLSFYGWVVVSIMSVDMRLVAIYPSDSSSWWSWAKESAAAPVAAVGGGVCAPVAAVATVKAVGFGAGGIAANSMAAGMMSWLAPTAAGGVVATCQSIGAVGLGAAAWPIAAIGGAVSFLGYRYYNSEKKNLSRL